MGVSPMASIGADVMGSGPAEGFKGGLGLVAAECLEVRGWADADRFCGPGGEVRP
jgi:hypothetical protein